jgi:hypothetical protein
MIQMSILLGSINRATVINKKVIAITSLISSKGNYLSVHYLSCSMHMFSKVYYNGKATKSVHQS